MSQAGPIDSIETRRDTTRYEADLPLHETSYDTNSENLAKEPAALSFSLR